MGTAAVSAPFQRRFSAASALAVTFGTSLRRDGEVVIVMHGDGPEEMEITLINCQADKSDEAACHHIP
jgi:redox-regulated HSP33 family molecular chaperone